MDIKGSSLYAQMQQMSLEATGVSPQNSPVVKNQSGAAFGELLTQALNNVNSLQKEGNAKATAFEMGDRSVSLADVMISKQKSSIAFEATVQVRNKMTEAFKEIMSMPV